MPACPICGELARAVGWVLVSKRADDGKQHVCRIVLYCVRDGARWRSADRERDPWSFDQVSTTWLARRFASTPD
jgi:hypothetical protein